MFKNYGNQSPSDNEFTRKARLLQSYYRVEFLKELKCGFGPNANSKTQYGNMLVDGEKENKNFFFQETFEYAKMRVANKHKDETINEYRLFNNMLSSMPMAFNLFHPLMMIKEKYPDQLDSMIINAFPEYPISHVTEIKIEYIPTPIKNYTNDKSAMDAAICFKDAEGNDYILAIETKYTDILGNNIGSNNIDKYTFAKEINQFTETGLEKIKNGCTQIYRNYLLTEKYADVNKFQNSYSIILAPKEHPSTEKEIESLQFHLKSEFRDKLQKYDLETFVSKLQVNCPKEYKDWLRTFYERYLNFSLIQ